MKIHYPRFWIFLALASVLLLMHAEAVLELANRAYHEERYSHAPLVLLVAIQLVWQARHAIRPSNEGGWPGVVLTGLASVGLVVGELSAIWTIVQYSLVLMLAGIAWGLVGRQFKKIAFPFFLLLTAVPLPYMVDVIISGKMQLLSSEIGATILRAIGVSVYLEGNIVDLGIYRLQVVEACSGLNYLFPLFTNGLMFAYYYRAPLFVRALLVLSTIPVTILMNSFRIAMVGILVNAQGIKAAEGFMHYFEGWVIFLVCTAILILFAWIADKLMGRKTAFIESFDLTPAEPDEDKGKNASGWQHPSSLIPLISIFVISVGISSANMVLATRDEAPLTRRQLVEFPMLLSSWHGRSYPFQNNENTILGLTDYLLADFTDGSSSVSLYIGFIDTQRKGFVPHSPRACIPGGGWEITEARRHEFKYGDKTIPVTRLLISLRDKKQVVYYWFRQRGRDMSNEYEMKYYLLRDSIFMNRTDGAIVRFSLPERQSPPATDAEAQRFMNSLYPALPAYIPD